MTTSVSEGIESSADLDVVAGVDTHADTHHVAILSVTGARLGDRQVPATATGYEQLLSYVRSFGSVRLVGIEGTSSYGAALSRYLRAQHVEIREIGRPRRSQR
ncbi:MULTISPECIES: IS110 family transposase [Citricoccus]|uniref:IS110 family transposase n=1 Tax=Citricoccus TaxID=169133 RepID=UPI000255EF34|nr:transposase [Citricoccus sp. CH26A]